ncbi:MAG TPA: pyruvate kinase [Actinomycetota bacterium]|nr:pyruvate kinase [Actinomycetota bacterium]
MMRRAKIVATAGPASRSREVLRELVGAGVDVLRLNLAHPSPEAHAQAARIAREEASAVGRVVAVLADLPGPKIRTGPIAGGEVVLEPGATLYLTTEQIEGDARRGSTTLAALPEIVTRGDQVFLADGEVILEVVSADGTDVRTDVVRGGILRSRKGMHLPQHEGRIEAFTEKDRGSLRDAVAMRADLVGLSFVRDADDLRRVRAELPDEDPPLLVAKIETRSAVENLAAIVDEADAVMVARGDLGIQTSLSELPLLQKRIIEACNCAGKPVITATQMLESMTRAPLPTRAEVADVANAVLDGTDALMLSEETAVGDRPVEVVKVMDGIITAAERSHREHQSPASDDLHDDDPVSWATAHAGVQAATDLKAAAILCPTRTGSTALKVAAFRPPMPVVGISPHSHPRAMLALAWGVVPLGSADYATASAEGAAGIPGERRKNDIDVGVRVALAAGTVVAGDVVVVVAGSAAARPGGTDLVRVMTC